MVQLHRPVSVVTPAGPYEAARAAVAKLDAGTLGGILNREETKVKITSPRGVTYEVPMSVIDEGREAFRRYIWDQHGFAPKPKPAPSRVWSEEEPIPARLSEGPPIEFYDRIASSYGDEDEDDG